MFRRPEWPTGYTPAYLINCTCGNVIDEPRFPNPVSWAVCLQCGQGYEITTREVSNQ